MPHDEYQQTFANLRNGLNATKQIDINDMRVETFEH